MSAHTLTKAVRPVIRRNDLLQIIKYSKIFFKVPFEL
jgi:hypothetical protein